MTDVMTPDEHYAEAHYQLSLAYGSDDWASEDGGPRDPKWRQRQAQIHATLALAGYTRGYAPGRQA
jgi:hypothetical protein